MQSLFRLCSSLGWVVNAVGVVHVLVATEAATADLQQFVATADGTGNLTIAISPAIVTSGAAQTVSASPADIAAFKRRRYQ